MTTELFVAPASFAQRQLWFLDQLTPHSPLYNLPQALRVTGLLDLQVLRQALDGVVARHSSLRTTFTADHGVPVQVIPDSAPTIECPLIDLSELDMDQREDEAQRLIVAEANRPFDLTEGPLVRASVVRLSAGDHILLITMHHIVSDGWSLDLFMRDLVSLYDSASTGAPSPPALAVQYADYAQWQLESMSGERLSRELDYWVQHLAGAPPILDLPTDHPRPAIQRFRGAIERLTLPIALARQLTRLSQQHGVTVAMSLQAAFQILLSRYSREEDIVIGTVSAGRTLAETEAIIGLFANTVVLRTDLSGDPTVAVMLARVRDVCLDAYTHQELPFEKLIERLQPARSLSHNPVFQVMFVNGELRDEVTSATGVTFYPLPIDGGTAKFDLTLNTSVGREAVSLALEYNTDLFERSTAQRMLGQIQRLLQGMVESPELPISRLPLLSTDERAQRLAQRPTASGTSVVDKPIVALFEEQVERTPDAVAVVCGEVRWSYRELNAQANRLARELRECGVGTELLVGLCAERSIELVVGILGILKAGGAYVPLDPSYPRERLAFVIGDADLRVIVTQRCLIPQLVTHNRRIVCIDSARDAAGGGEENEQNEENIGTRIAPESAAYVIYTSGSTGQPKGVLVTHENVVRLFRATEPWFHFDDRDVWTLFHSYGFDFSVWELFGALLHGGRLVVVPYLVSRSPDAFYELLQREHVTVLNQTPSAFEQLIQAEERAESDTGLALRLVIFGGEALDFQSLRPWFARHGDQKPQLVNMYGITETTVHVTYRPITQQDVTGRGSLLGVPIPDLQVHLLDAHLEPVPIGVPGELYVGGAGLARGYLNRPELTANRFIHPPFASDPRARLYKSGDLARYRSDGELEYLGRIDHQVKIRGFRVELGEIESVLDSHPGVRVSVVRVLDDQSGHKRLVAYVVPDTGASPTVHELRALVRSVLPEYMVPAAFVTLDALPLTPNGKIDRRALPLPVASPTGGQTAARVAPRTPVEHAIAQVWAGVLGFSAEQLSVDDNFFDLGGHSLIAMQVTARLRDALGLDVPVRSIFEHPTIAGLADDVEIARARATPSQLPSLVPVARDQPIALSVAQEQLWFLDQLQPGLHAYNMPEALRLRGPVNIQALERSLQDLGERHESLRTTFMATDGKPFQVIASHCELPLAIVDLGDVPDVNRDTTLAGLVDAEIRRPFDLATGPLLRTTLIRLGEDDHVLLLIAHHIVSDGWSQSVLWRELGVLYEAHAAGHTPVLPPVTTQYADYARWQREWLSSREGQEQIAYWKRQMLGAPALLPLPTDRPRSGSRSFAGAKQSQTLSRATVRQIKTLTQQEGATLFMTLLAAFDTLLLRYTRTTDIVVGTDVANRQLVETEGIVGFFVNNVIMRTDMSGDPTFRELLGRVREVALAAYAHQEVPFGTLVDVLKPPRSLGHSPLCQVLFVLQNTPASALSVRGVEVTPIDVDMRTSKFDVAVFVVEVEEQLEVTWVYRTDLFDAPTIRRAMDHFALLLESAAANPAVPLSKLTMATEAERSQRMQAETERPVTTSLKGARRRAVNLGEIKSVKTSFLAEGDTFPLVVQPEIADVSLAEWARSSHEFIESSLLKHGALLFRGFGLKSLADFEQFVESICPELFDEYGDLPREGASGKIYKSTPYPNNLPILFHNESSHMHQWPRKIWFHCVVAAERGGETPLVDCRTIYNALDPAIRDRFAEKGLMYVRNYTDGLDVSWEDFFQTSNRSAVEEYCRKASIDFEWKGEHGLRTTQLCPAVVRHPKTNEPIFFNQIQLHHVSCLEPAVRESLTEMFREEDLPRNVYYGDGTAIPDALVQEMVDLYWRTSVAPPWQPGDVIMLDNMLVAHARNPFEGARKIVVAMGELIHKAGVITIAPHA